MVSSDDSIIVSLKNSIVTKINTLIGNHDRSNTAHSDIRNSIPTTTSRLTNDSGFITSNDVKNNLTSTDTNKPLSANQGRLLRLMDGEPIVLKVTGNSFEESWIPTPNTALQGNNIVVDYGDGTIELLENKLRHDYIDGNNNHTIKIYNITSIGDSCFEECEGLTSITLPNSITSIGDSCFSGCTGLTSITLPNSITSLGDYCFFNCTSLTSITLPNSITSLGDYCIFNCTSLTSITIHDNITSIGSHCFEYCTNLTNYYLNWTSSSTIITYDSNKMPNNTNTIFHIPYGTTANYVAKGFPSNKLQEEVYVKTSEQTTNSITDNDLRPVTSNAVNDAINEIDTLLNNKVDTSDSRLTNARTPTSHSHGDITNTGKIGTFANKPIITTTNGKLTTGSFGTTANTFCQGNDSRLSNARTPTAHTHTKSDITDFLNAVYPVGSIYMSVNNTSPATLFGGTWVQLKDRFLLGAGDTYSNGATGGSANAVVVEHNHSYSNGGEAITVAANSSLFTNGFGPGVHWNNTKTNIGSINKTGESGTGKNMPPYLVVYMWKRTA